jgi:hypothetical protein
MNDGRIGLVHDRNPYAEDTIRPLVVFGGVKEEWVLVHRPHLEPNIQREEHVRGKEDVAIPKRPCIDGRIGGRHDRRHLTSLFRHNSARHDNQTSAHGTISEAPQPVVHYSAIIVSHSDERCPHVTEAMIHRRGDPGPVHGKMRGIQTPAPEFL